MACSPPGVCVCICICICISSCAPFHSPDGPAKIPPVLSPLISLPRHAFHFTSPPDERRYDRSMPHVIEKAGIFLFLSGTPCNICMMSFFILIFPDCIHHIPFHPASALPITHHR
jgi:hypothetical protein